VPRYPQFLGPALAPFRNGALAGIGGQAGSVLVGLTLELLAVDGSIARFKSSFPAFLAPDASDIDLLGRDVLDHFDVIISYRRREVLLLAPNHSYQVVLAP
jgi:hypothetical protein